MNNVRLYAEVCKLKNYLEDHDDQPKDAVRQATILVMSIWPLLERRGRKV